MLTPADVEAGATVIFVLRETTLDGDEGTVVHVRLHARVSEVGTLDLSAVDIDSERRWKLSFDVRMD